MVGEDVGIVPGFLYLRVNPVCVRLAHMCRGPLVLLIETGKLRELDWRLSG